jgi:hypothetical protein
MGITLKITYQIFNMIFMAYIIMSKLIIIRIGVLTIFEKFKPTIQLVQLNLFFKVS